MQSDPPPAFDGRRGGWSRPGPPARSRVATSGFSQCGPDSLRAAIPTMADDGCPGSGDDGQDVQRRDGGHAPHLGLPLRLHGPALREDARQEGPHPLPPRPRGKVDAPPSPPPCSHTPPRPAPPRPTAFLPPRAIHVGGEAGQERLGCSRVAATETFSLLLRL